MTTVILPIPPSHDLVAAWAFIEAGLERVMGNPRESIGAVTHIGIYSAVHNLCTVHRDMRSIEVDAITALTHDPLSIYGAELYKKLKDYLTKHLVEIYEDSKNYVDEALLSYYMREWDRYTMAAKRINTMFGYLNRVWLKHEIDYWHRENLYDVYNLHLAQWGEVIFTERNIDVMAGVLKMVEEHRNGKTIDKLQIKNLVDSLVTLDLDEANGTTPTLELYRYHFERPFLEATTRYYESKSLQLVSEDNVFEYEKVETWMDEEKSRVEQYLHHESIIPVVETCFRASLAAHSGLLKDKFQLLLDSDQQDDLARMYRFFAKRIEVLEPLKERFETHIKKSGLAVVEEVAVKGDNLEPKMYFDTLLEVHIQYQKLVDDVFAGDSGFIRSLDRACKEFFNQNKVCKRGSTRSPELLAKYTDTLLKNREGAEKADLEASLDQFMMVFKYIEDKDTFKEFYLQMLSRRLSYSNWAPEDAELSMIRKLKDAYGFVHTHEFRQVLEDFKNSKEVNGRFKEWQGKTPNEDDMNKEFDSTYHVLDARVWPLTPPTTAFIPSPEIVNDYTGFQKLYSDKHSRRDLTWLWNLCKGEIQANHVKTAKVPYTFLVSAYQMAILLLFNDANIVTYEEAQKTTMLSADTLDPSLDVFVEAKVLNPSPENGKPGPGTSYTLNHEFKSDQVKVNLNVAVISEQRKEMVHTHKTVEQDRKLLLQSTMVRIMKSSKKMKHFELMQETISRIEPRFAPKISDIKESIDRLVEKEYLERLDGEQLGYLC